MKDTIDAIIVYVSLTVIFGGSFLGIILATMSWRKRFEAGMRLADRKYADRQRRERDA
jgi:Na+/proline symporter